MYSEQDSSTIIIPSSDSESEDGADSDSCVELQSSALHKHVLTSEDDAVDDDNDSLTPPRPKRSKCVHAGAAVYKCKFNSA